MQRLSQIKQFERRLWMFRTPKSASMEHVAITEGLLVMDCGVREDLCDHYEHGMILDEVMQANPGETTKAVDRLASQLHTFLNVIQPGDLVLSPSRRSNTVAIGFFKPGTTSCPDGMPARHVEWLTTEVPKSAFLPDMIHSMGANWTVCEITRNGSLGRIEEILRSGRDPGPVGQVVDMPGSSGPRNLARLQRNQILSHIGAVFAGHAMADLVSAVLVAQGYRVLISPPGPDGGIDIMAGRGPLGLDATLVVQVKSGDIVADHQTFQQLLGAMQSSGASQALLVSWSGVTRPVRARAKDFWLQMRIWDADDLLDAIQEVYADLPGVIRTRITLQQSWSLAINQ